MKSPIVNYIIRNHFLASLLILAFFWLMMELSEILIIVFISFIITAALSPFADFLNKKHIPHALSVLLTYFVTLVILVLLIFPIVPFFIDQIQGLFKSFPKYINQVAQLLNIHLEAENINTIFASGIDTIGKNALSFTGKVFSGVFSTLTVLVISFYLMLGRDRLKQAIMSFFPQNYQKSARETITQVEKKLGAWFRGQLILSFSIGLTTWIALTLLGLPFALPLALVAGILEIIPTIGPIISAIPAVIVAMTISPSIALSVVIFYIIIQMVENNILVPKIMEKAVGLNPIIIIIGVLIGSKFLGILGALLAVPFIAMLVIIFKTFRTSN